MRNISEALRLAAAIAALAALAACGGTGMSPSAAMPTNANPASVRAFLSNVRHHTSGKIQHVVIIVQENRSFDNLFQGFPGADTRSWGYDSNNNKVTLNPIGLETTWDIDHSSGSFFTACNGAGKYPGTKCRMNGFNKEYIGCGSGCPYPESQYAYVPHSETAPYFAMGQQYVVADRMFASNFDASSFISHQYIISGQAGKSAVNYPSSSWGCDGGSGDQIGSVSHQRIVGGPYQQVCWDDKTLGDEADVAGVSWGFYSSNFSGDGGFWNAYDAIRHIRYGSDWSKNMRNPSTQFFTDIQNGNLPAISWVIPTWGNSDHAGNGSKTGPSWVASLVNAVGQSQYWNSTAIFIFWDDYGGWYDHVGPKKLDYDGLGMRLPLLIISPYAKQGYVSHVPYEHGSILKFTEDQFGLGRLTASDTRATSPAADAFDFSKPPRAFSPFAAPFGRAYFMHQPIDRHPPDTE
jgi:phospholipase C